MSPFSFTAPHNPAQNEFLCITHTDCVTMVTTVLLQQLEMLQGISDHHQLGSATWTGGNSRRLKEAEGPEISIFGALWPSPRPDNINVGITLSFFITIFFFFFHSWIISQLCCAWKQNVSSHAGQHRADCLHKAGQIPVHRSPLTSAWIPLRLVYLLTQLQAPSSHHFGSWKITLCHSCDGVFTWVHFSG